MRQFFVSDTHFGHSRIIEYCNRPFDDVHLMNLAMTTYWNDTVGENDVVYHLGDFCFGNPDKYLAGLHGTITFVQGSHDKDLVKLQEAGGLGKHKLLHGYQEIHIAVYVSRWANDNDKFRNWSFPEDSCSSKEDKVLLHLCYLAMWQSRKDKLKVITPEVVDELMESFKKGK